MTRAPFSIRLRDAILAARARGASDLHLDVERPPTARIDGRLECVASDCFTASELAEMATLLIGSRVSTLESSGDVSETTHDAELGTFRTHVYRGSRGFVLAIRLLGRCVPSLESLHLPEIVSALPACERGLVIVAGPTGSGKSTTLASIVDCMNATHARRIVTIEDPIEYVHESRLCLVTQREVGRDTPTIGSALRGVLRADPDAIVVGEMRDTETIRGVLTAAETGHLVMTTLHTGDATQTIGRIVDAFAGPEQAHVRAQLAQVLVCVLCQHLVRRATGKGRLAAVEVLVGTSAVLNLIREGKTHQLHNAMATGRSHGMQTLEQHLHALAGSNEIEQSDARALEWRPGRPDAAASA